MTREISLDRKVVGALLLAIAAALVLSALSFAWFEYRTVRSRVQVSLETLAAVTSRSLQASLAIDDRATMASTLHDLRASPFVVDVWIHHSDGSIIAPPRRRCISRIAATRSRRDSNCQSHR